MNTLPATCGIAFKEWAGVCDALSRGEQSLILRKGGIREESGDFVPEHRAFWLYPTHVHESQQGLRRSLPPAETRQPDGDPRSPVHLRSLVLVELTRHLDAEAQLAALESFHVWNEETVLKRFHYRKPGLWVLGVRVYRRDEPWIIVPTEEQLGCKSWVSLDSALATTGLRPVLEDEEHARLLDRLSSVLP
jgi:hypothetical protein